MYSINICKIKARHVSFFFGVKRLICLIFMYEHDLFKRHDMLIETKKVVCDFQASWMIINK